MILASASLVFVFAMATLKLNSQSAAAPQYSSLAGTTELDYVCPMDPDVRSDKPGKCARCGMTLKLGVPSPIEYSLALTTSKIPRPGESVQIRFAFEDPRDKVIVKKFEIVHEKLFHLFVVSEDLKYFRHDHPVFQPDGTFTIEQTFPKAGMYRLLVDVYPAGGTPQLLPKTVFVAPDASTPALQGEANLKPDERIQHGENTDAELILDSPKPIAGLKTHVTFKFNTAEQMQQYLGAWAHMLIASDDLIDLIHSHPFIANGGPQIQFDVIFPRARTYRLWVQFQRKDVVNTIAVNIPVVTLEQAQGLTPNVLK